MAIACPRCHRQYDVTLFEYGRTIRCTCGERVGLAHRIQHARGGDPRFFADAMLERLARWLRILGFDTAFEQGIRDDALVRRAVTEGRVILTRDRGLAGEWTADNVVLIEAATTGDQLAEVVRKFALCERLRPLTRCNRCNVPLREIESSAARERVPPRIRAVCDRFVECPSCERVYWEGSHASRMRTVIEHLSASAAGADWRGP